MEDTGETGLTARRPGPGRPGPDDARPRSTMSLHNDVSGLPDADEYRPEAIGEAALSAGDPEQTWDKWGLEMVPVLHDGEDTGRRIIRRNGEYIAMVSDEYKLLPNERVVEAANEVARELGARPFHQFDGEWFVKLDDHVYQDPERRRVHALYAWDTDYVGDDRMEYGFAVHNSIDSSLAFSVALFSFRHACANMVHIGTGGYRDRMAQNVESERSVLTESKHKHTSGLDVEVEQLTALVKGNLTLANSVNETYKQWQREAVDLATVEDLIGRFPNQTYPVWLQEAMEEIDGEREERAEAQDVDKSEVVLPDNLRADILRASIPSAENKWDTYNDLTQAIWHNKNTSDATKQGRMDNLHRAMNPLAVQADD